MKGYVVDTFFKQSPLCPLVCLVEIQTPSFPDWVTFQHQSAVNVAMLNFSTNVCHLQQSEETPSLLHKLAIQAHELGLPCVICELHFVRLLYIYLIYFYCFLKSNIIVINVICIVIMIVVSKLKTNIV